MSRWPAGATIFVAIAGRFGTRDITEGARLFAD